MKKAIIYLMIYVGITLIAVLFGLLLSCVFSGSVAGILGVGSNEAIVYSVTIAGVLWAVAIVGLFVYKRYATLTWGSLSGWGRVQTTIASMLFVTSVNIVAYWAVNRLTSYSVGYHNLLETFISHPLNTLLLEVSLYATTQTVFFGAILNALLNTWKRPWVAIAVVTLLLSFFDFTGDAPSFVIMLAALVTNITCGLVYCATRSILPGFLSCLFADYSIWMGLAYHPSTPVACIAAGVAVVSSIFLTSSLRREWS